MMKYWQLILAHSFVVPWQRPHAGDLASLCREEVWLLGGRGAEWGLCLDTVTKSLRKVTVLNESYAAGLEIWPCILPLGIVGVSIEHLPICQKNPHTYFKPLAQKLTMQCLHDVGIIERLIKNTLFQMYRTDFWTLWEKARVGCFKGTASKHVFYLGWNRSPAQVGCMRQVLGPGALGRPRGIGWRGRWEGGLEWGVHVYPWLIHVNVWQKPLQHCKVISLQLIKKQKGYKVKKRKVIYGESRIIPVILFIM